MNDIRFADDQAMIANNENELQKVVELLDRSAKKFKHKDQHRENKSYVSVSKIKRLRLIWMGKEFNKSNFLYIWELLLQVMVI